MTRFQDGRHINKKRIFCSDFTSDSDRSMMTSSTVFAGPINTILKPR